MSGITIGRMGLDIEVPGLTAAGWVDDGDTVTVTATNWALGLEEGRVLRQQILGLSSSSEPHYLTSEDDSERDGWYRVLSANIISEPLWKTDGHLSWTATLARPLNYAALRPEILLSGTERTSAPVTPVHWVGIPEGYGWGFQEGTPTLGDRYLLDGTQVTVASGADLADRNTVRMTGPPEIYFSAACVFKVDGYPTIGRQTYRNPADWELSNGFVTITPGVSDSALFTIQVQDPGGGGAVAPTLSYELELGINPSGTWIPGTDQTIHSVQVLRDTVEEVVIRISGLCNLSGASIPRNAFSLDLSLRRGALGVDMTPTFVEADEYGFGWVTTVASSNISASNVGIRKTSADADGMYPMIVHPAAGFVGAWDRDLTNGRIWLDTVPWAGGASFFVGMSEESLSASTALNLQAAYFSTVRGRQRMVSP